MFEKPLLEQGELIEIGEALAGDIERAEKKRIQLETFRGIPGFSNAEIDADLAFVETKKNQHEKGIASSPPELARVQADARIIEFVLPLAIHDYDWLGKDTEVIHTSIYDDYANYIDSVAQLKEPGETRNLGMEIDFTSSESAMANKIKIIGSSIREGRITRVKYFDSPTTGKIKNVEMPKIAFGVPKNEMISFTDMLVEARKNPRYESAKKALENHAVRKKFLAYTANQLREYARIAAEAGNAKHALLHNNVLETMKKRGLVA